MKSNTEESQQYSAKLETRLDQQERVNAETSNVLQAELDTKVSETVLEEVHDRIDALFKHLQHRDKDSDMLSRIPETVAYTPRAGSSEYIANHGCTIVDRNSDTCY